MALLYELTKQYAFKVEEVVAKFTHEKDAMDYMKERVHRDHVTKVETTWRLYHQSELVHEVHSLADEAAMDSGQGNPSSGSRFNPTPLSTSLKPGGLQSHYDKDDDDDI